MDNILITGGNGYLAGNLISKLLSVDTTYKICASVRHPIAPPAIQKVQWYTNKSLDLVTDWSDALENVESVIHIAARVHIMGKQANNISLREFRRSNVLGTQKLVEQAATAKVKRFIFISSIGVNGSTTAQTPFKESDTPHPSSAYSQSKWEAEKIVKEICESSNIDYAILRPPLIYGFNAPGNFRLLIKLIQRGFPLLFSRVKNKRSIIAVENLVDLIIKVLEYPNNINEVFLVSDKEVLSTHEIMLTIKEGMQKHNMTFPIPPKLLYISSKILDKESLYQRLCTSLQIDTTKVMTFFDWIPSIKTFDSLFNVGKRYKDETHN